MKNSTQWCNLYSNASKYNITIKGSRSAIVFYALFCAFILLAAVVWLTYYYLFALCAAVLCILGFNLFLSKVNDYKIDKQNSDSNDTIQASLLISTEGELIFKDDPTRYQLLPTSRLNFLGVWLVMQPTRSTNTFVSHSFDVKARTPSTKRYFIYRDSLGHQDYSRLANVIQRLNYPLD